MTYATRLLPNLSTIGLILAAAGTVITSVGHFGNSAQNPFNPDPSLAVPWGEMSWDEMFFGEFIYKAANK